MGKHLIYMEFHSALLFSLSKTVTRKVSKVKEN